VARSVEAGQVISGSPEMEAALWKRNTVLLRKLPELVRTVTRLKKEVAELRGEKKTRKKKKS